jgi:hypothetical protein
MAKYINWHGTTQDSQRLQQVLNRHCACRLSSDRRLDRCGPHQLLAEDHAVLNRLLFVRHILERLQREEHMLKSGSHQIAEAAG